MKLNNLMAIKAVIFVIVGILCVLLPTTFMSLSGVTINQAGAFTTQLLGAMLILISILLWSARNAPRSDVALRAIVLAVIIGDLIGFIISLLAQLNKVANALGWIFVALWLLLACGFGYFQFVKPANS
jgi:hypothetical protein